MPERMEDFRFLKMGHFCRVVPNSKSGKYEEENAAHK